MSKILAIGDIHGRSTWQRFVNPELYDKIIFIGDYFDSFDVPGEEQIRNFLNIMEFKHKYPEKVVLLIGNHDFHYLDMGEHYPDQTGCFHNFTIVPKSGRRFGIKLWVCEHCDKVVQAS